MGRCSLRRGSYRPRPWHACRGVPGPNAACLKGRPFGYGTPERHPGRSRRPRSCHRQFRVIASGALASRTQPTRPCSRGARISPRHRIAGRTVGPSLPPQALEQRVRLIQPLRYRLAPTVGDPREGDLPPGALVLDDESDVRVVHTVSGESSIRPRPSGGSEPLELPSIIITHADPARPGVRRAERSRVP